MQQLTECGGVAAIGLLLFSLLRLGQDHFLTAVVVEHVNQPIPESTDLHDSSERFPVSQPQLERSVDDEKELILILVRVPDELSLELGQLHLLAIELGDDLRIPVTVKLGQLLSDVDLLHPDLPSPLYIARRDFLCCVR